MSEHNQSDKDNQSVNSRTEQPNVHPPATNMDAASADSADVKNNDDSLTDQSGVHPAGTRRRVTNAALAGAAFGAVVSAAAAALTGKSVSDGVKVLAEVAVDKLKEAVEGVQPALENAFSTAEGSQPNVENTGNAVQESAESFKPSVENAGSNVQPSAERTQPSVVPPSIPAPVEAPAATASYQSVASHATPSATNNETLNMANDAMNNHALVQLLLSQVSSQLAMSFYEQLPAAVLAEVQRLATNPTPEERQRIRDSWAKALEPVAIAIVQSVQSFDANAVISAANNGHYKQHN